MPIPNSNMPRLAEITALAIREHGSDWPGIRRAIADALDALTDAERAALDAEIVASDGLISGDGDKLDH